MSWEVWNRAAESYESTGVTFFAPLGRELVDRAGLRPGDRVLDLGTGRGHVLYPALDRVGQGGHVTGIDMAENMVHLTAAELTGRGVANATVRLGDAAAPPFEAATFDAVLAGFVMFMLPEPQAALRAHRALLTARGRLAFSTYARYDERVDAARAVLRRWADLPARPSTVDDFDDREYIRRVVQGAGFGNESIADVPVVTTFDSAAQWWDWAWSVGFRAALEKIPPDRRAGARAEAERALGIDGGAGLSITTVIRYTTADAGR